MSTKKGLLIMALTFTIIFTGVAACSQNLGGSNNQPEQEAEGLTIATSFDIINGLVAEVIGDRGTTHHIVPFGEEPHEYEPVSSDFALISDADVFFTNGLGLEEWLETVLSNVSDIPVVELSEGIEVLTLHDDSNITDPHAWLDAANILIYVDNIVSYLSEADPDGQELYEHNAEAFKQQLIELDEWIHEEVQQIPESQRLIATSENAFVYFGAAYGFETAGIWELNAHEEGTPQQYARMVDLVKERNIPALFVETTMNPQHMQTVSDNSGIPIFGEVYTDGAGAPGSDHETYIDFMRHNVQTFVEGLGQ